ncbi:hypothetical protein Hdeb2414_s0007g00240581 [Helianthus debilis subsp. tardiflorus]
MMMRAAVNALRRSISATAPPNIEGNRTLWFRFISSRSGLNEDRDNGGGHVTLDDALFAGCDQRHWLITMEFEKDPESSHEEMVETYVQTAAKVLGRYSD